MATLDQARRLVESLSAELINRRPAIEKANQYYKGQQPLLFASDQFREFHGNRYKGFADNWVQVVSDSPVERLTVNGIHAAGADRPDQESQRVWLENGLDADSQLGFLGAVNSARSFVRVWGNMADPDTPDVTFLDASNAIVLYARESRRKRVAALTLWEYGGLDHATLYLPNEVWKFRRMPLGTPEKSVGVRDAEQQVMIWDPIPAEETGDARNPQRNPMGLVPVVELPNRPTLVGEPVSDVANVIPMQDAVNLVWAYLLTAADVASFPARVVTGAEIPEVPITDASGKIVGSKPVDIAKFAMDRVMFFEGDNVKIDEWSAANLSQYTLLIETAVGHIAAQTRTPQHYLIGKMANLSGDALIAAETGLVKRVQEKQIWYGQALREMYRLIALAQGDKARAGALASGRILWADAESRSHAQLTDALLKKRQMGYPFEWLAKESGLTPTEVADLMRMRKREAELDPVGALSTLMERSAPDGNDDAGEGASAE